MKIAKKEITAWAPRDYVKIDVKPGETMVDVGPGGYPHPRANLYVDCDITNVERLEKIGKKVVLSDLEQGLPEIEDKAFDYAWCSHALEHIVDLPKAVEALNRIAKRGCIVVPSFAKEAMLHFQERDHFWICLPNPTSGGPIIFVEHNHGFLEKLRDPLAQQATSFLYQTGSHHDCTAEQWMRGWWQRTERDLDIVCHWDEQHPLKVITVR
jgi:SAM-dependent methyltransferase